MSTKEQSYSKIISVLFWSLISYNLIILLPFTIQSYRFLAIDGADFLSDIA